MSMILRALSLLLLQLLHAGTSFPVLSYYVCNKTAQSTDPRFICPSTQDGGIDSLNNTRCATCINITEAIFFNETIKSCACDKDDVVVGIEWEFPQHTSCSAPCNETLYYRSCRNSTECRHGDCCMKPSREVLQVIPWNQQLQCGPHAACGCSEDFLGSLACTADCPPLGYFGVCINPEKGIFPGHSCDDDPCQELDWIYEACGFNGTDFTSILAECSDSCVTALDRCPLVPLIEKRTSEWTRNNCGECNKFYHQQCASDDDCKEGTCCQLPLNEAVMVDRECGSPATCECVDEDGGITIQCSQECSNSSLGRCITIGNEPDWGYVCKSECPDKQSSSKACRRSSPSIPYAWIFFAFFATALLLMA